MLKTNVEFTALFLSCNANVLSNSAPVCSVTYMGQLYFLFRHEESHTSTVRDLMKLIETMWVTVFAPKKGLKFSFAV